MWAASLSSRAAQRLGASQHFWSEKTPHICCSRLPSYVAALQRCEFMIGLYAARNTLDLARAVADLRGSTFAELPLLLGARLRER